MPLNLNQLAVFHAVAEAGGVTRGAERLMVSQPAVSKQLKELERSLGCRLLERHGRGVRLTDAGAVLAAYARDIFARAAEAEAALADVAALRRGRLSVGATPTIGTYLLPEALVYFRQRFPGVRVDVETAGPAALAGRLADGSLDVALADETLAFPGMARRKFTDVPFVAILTPRHRLARARRVSLASLAATAGLVLRASESGSGSGSGGERSPVERFLADRGLDTAAALTFGSTEAVKRAVEAGLGAGIVPRLAVERELAAGRVRVVRVPELNLSRPLFEVWDGGRPRGKAAQAFHCVLEHVARGTLPKPRKNVGRQ